MVCLRMFVLKTLHDLLLQCMIKVHKVLLKIQFISEYVCVFENIEINRTQRYINFFSFWYRISIQIR